MSQNQKVWEINGLSLELDLDDADVMERYEKAFDVMSAEEKALPKDGKGSEQIRAYCAMFRHLYDNIFGEGTSEKIFKGVPTSASAYDDIYFSFLDAVKKIKTATIQSRAERLAKYRPANRQQKRAAAKKK